MLDLRTDGEDFGGARAVYFRRALANSARRLIEVLPKSVKELGSGTRVPLDFPSEPAFTSLTRAGESAVPRRSVASSKSVNCDRSAVAGGAKLRTNDAVRFADDGVVS